MTLVSVDQPSIHRYLASYGWLIVGELQGSHDPCSIFFFIRYRHCPPFSKCSPIPHQTLVVIQTITTFVIHQSNQPFGKCHEDQRTTEQRIRRLTKSCPTYWWGRATDVTSIVQRAKLCDGGEGDLMGHDTRDGESNGSTIF